MLELLNQLDGFDGRGDVKVRMVFLGCGIRTHDAGSSCDQ